MDQTGVGGGHDKQAPEAGADAPPAGERRIPRIIHQVYLTGELPPLLQKNVNRLKELNPNWEHRLYDSAQAERFIRDRYGAEMLAIYHRIAPEYRAARVDLLCNLLIHDAGGVYLDIKSSFDRPLDDVVRVDDSYVLAHWQNGPGQPNAGWGLHRDLAHIPRGEYMKHFIIAEPRHPYSASIIRKIVENVKRYRPWSAVGRTGTLRTTGPIAYTLGIHAIRDQHPHRFATEKELGAVYSIGGDYNHQSVFTKHYSMLTTPVVTLSPAGAALSRVFVALRNLKHRLMKTNDQS